uniref:Shadow of prion protein n=1 Tax=Scleropages formosus TaxID=113540 RepID=A0A8C9S8N4_SCLFO
MNRAAAACWTFILLSAFFCETVICKGGRGGARGSARGSARASRTRARYTGRYSGSQTRVAAAAAAGAAVGLAAGGWYASSQSRSHDSSETFGSDERYGNWTSGDLYSARASTSSTPVASFRAVGSAFCLIHILIHISL